MGGLQAYKLDVEIKPYSDLDEYHGKPSSPYYLRIGDTQFVIPPTSIKVENESPTDLIPVLRSNSSLKMRAGRQTTMLTIELFFHNLTSINGKPVENPLRKHNVDAKTRNKKYYYIDGLRSLIAQFGKCPFLPIENEYINDVLGIDAVTLANLEVQTVPSFPNTLKATLQMYRFNYHGYLPWIDTIVQDDKAPLFKQIFNWPLFRWYYQRDMDDSSLISGQIKDDIRFKILKESELKEREKARMRLSKDRKKLSKTLDEALKEHETGTRAASLDEQSLNLALTEYWQIRQIADEADGNIQLAISEWRKRYGVKPKYVRNSRSFEDVAIVLPGLQSPSTIELFKELGRIKDGRAFLYPEKSPARTEVDERLEQTIKGRQRRERLERFIAKNKDKDWPPEEAEKKFDSQDKTREEIAAEVRDNHAELERLEKLAAKTEADISTIDIDTPGLLLQHMSISLRNIVTQVPLQIQDEPLHQYLGSQDIVISAQLYATNKDTVAAVRAMVEHVNQLQIAYRDEIVPGIIEVENDLMRLFGVDTVVVERMTIDTTDSPDLWEISLVMIQFNKTQRQAESLDGVSGSPSVDPDRQELDAINGSMNDIRSQILLKKRMRSINPYPDLDLPTWEEVRKALTALCPGGRKLGHVGKVDAKYADPDFYIMTSHTLADLIEMAVNAGSSSVLVDKYGYKAEVVLPSDGGHAKIKVDEAFKNDMEECWDKATTRETDPETGDDNHLQSAPPELGPSFQKESDGMYSFESPIFQMGEGCQFGSKEIPSTRDMFIGMLHDVLTYTKQGRLVRAFPTFHVFIVDEGKGMSYYRLWDNLYGLHGIQSIDIHRSRKNAADTCVMRISNLYGNLDHAPKDDKKHEFLFINYFFDEMSWEMIGDRVRLRDQLKVKTGCRLHVRLGYGSDISSLPIAFNGVITELDAKDTVQLIAQSDAIELTNTIPSNQYDTNRMTNYGNEPRNIILEMLADEGAWLKELVREVSAGKLYRDNGLGIFHFGCPRWVVEENVPPPQRTKTKDLSELAMNIYPAGGKPTKEEDVWLWAALRGLVGVNDTPDEPNMQFYLYDKSPWDIFNMLALAIEDYIVSAQPFELRSTLFYGKPQWPFIYGYDYAGNWSTIETVNDIQEDLIKTKSKTFQQLHFLTSEFDIIENGIKASSQGVYTRVRATYKDNTVGPGSYQMYDTMTVQADSDIDPEHQRLARVHTGLVHRGWFPVATTKRIAEMIAANSLRDFLKDMYKGDLVIFGNPSLKPHDYINLSDSYTSMYGPILVEQVVHHIGLDTGFITTVRPDALVTTGNSIVGIFNWCQAAHTTLASVLAWMPMQHILKAKPADTLLGLIVNSLSKNLSATEIASAVGTKVINSLKQAGNITQQAFTAAANKQMAEAILQATSNGDAIKIAKQLAKSEISLTDASAQLTKLADTLSDLGEAAEMADTVQDLHRISRATEIIRNGVAGIGEKIKGGGELWDGIKSFGQTLRSTTQAKKIMSLATNVAVVVIAEGLFDYFMRWARNRQRCLIFPLTKHGNEFVAGIDGHRGAVWGDKQSTTDKIVKVAGMIAGLPLLDFRFWTSELDYSPGTDEDNIEWDDFKKMFDPSPITYSKADLPMVAKQIRSPEWYQEIISLRESDNPPESAKLMDYVEMTDSNFYRFRDESQRKLLPAMISKLTALEKELRLHYSYVNVAHGYAKDPQKELGPLQVTDYDEWGKLVQLFEKKIENIEYLPHAAGLAIDIEYTSETQRQKIIDAARKVGFGASVTSPTGDRGCIAINKDYGYVHLDLSPGSVSLTNIAPKI